MSQASRYDTSRNNRYGSSSAHNNSAGKSEGPEPATTDQEDLAKKLGEPGQLVQGGKTPF